MEIKTKYEIGQKIWCVSKENNKDLCVYSDFICEISVSSEGLKYLTKYAFNELREEDIILYDDAKKLINKIKEIDNQFYQDKGE